MASIPTQEEVLAATRKGQEAMMAAVKTWLEMVRTAAPKLPSKLPQVSLPFADRLPTPQDAVANAYHLAEQLLASQRRFAEELVKATAPLRPGYRESSPEVPSPRAWQDATDSEPKTPAIVAAPKAAASTTPKAAESIAPKAAPKAAESIAPKAAPAPRTTAAKRTTAGSASATAASARKSTTGTSARKSTTASSAGAARKNAGTTTPAPKGTGKS
jgi:hypothetical protein